MPVGALGKLLPWLLHLLPGLRVSEVAVTDDKETRGQGDKETGNG
jgi:hypothetical protein